MSGRNTVIRSLHDLGLAAWFGGSLMGAVGLNGAARQEGATETAQLHPGPNSGQVHEVAQAMSQRAR
ncbi:hypothetical protein [Streptomyces sp. NPDC058145]|uniref:hypothetical protein n=1 Tax=Streptomyces sp. NPDC058145 TaxID=3346356 RepID=UPI0036E42C33